MNGKLFKTLTSLKTVQLNRNACINENFFGNRIEDLPKVVNEKCGFDEVLIDDDLPPPQHLFDIPCGNVSFSTGFVIGGKKTERGQWPFLVALYNQVKQKFFCGGSLITSQHVLTGEQINFNFSLLLNEV